MSELSEAINEMRTMREAYDQLGAAAEAYNAGKTELAANINAKGVEASATETLPELAEKVAAIAQETYEINGGEMYAKQLFGSLETPNYWNLYDILAQLLSDGRLVSYGGILLAEYYRGYDSLALSGAGAGGAYVVSDLDEQGNFKMYTEDTTHTWATEFDGRGNRWVAYCFADEYHDFQITNTNTSPRSIFIGRKVGTITSLVAGRVSQIVVPDGNELYQFISTYSQSWDRKTILKNIGLIGGKVITGGVSDLYLDANEITFTIFNGVLFDGGIVNAIIKSPKISIKNDIPYPSGTSGIVRGNSLQTLIVESESIYLHPLCGLAAFAGQSPIREVYILGNESLNGDGYLLWPNNSDASYLRNFRYVFVGYKNNDKTKIVILRLFNSVTDVEIQSGWNKPIAVINTTALTEANMYAHILQKLKQDEPNCGSGVTITLGSANLARLTSEESQALLAELRGTYGYTFA